MIRLAPCGRGRWGAALVLSAAAAISGCSTGVGTLSFPNPPDLGSLAPQAPAATFPAGLAASTENPVAGATTTTAPAVGPGPATLNGTVLGPAGPLGGAVVEADRLVGNSVAVTRTTTAADGSWAFHGILGGRYRVRAWQRPDLDLTEPQIIFLAADKPQSLTLTLAAYPRTEVSAAVNPAAPVVNQPANLVVQVTKPSIGSDGVVSFVPVSGVPVYLIDGPSWSTYDPAGVITDASGRALFSVVCTSPGPAALSAQVATSTAAALQLPPCSPAPPTQPVVTAPPVAGPGSTTATSCPPTAPSSALSGPSSTTTSLLYGNC